MTYKKLARLDLISKLSGSKVSAWIFNGKLLFFLGLGSSAFQLFQALDLRIFNKRRHIQSWFLICESLTEDGTHGSRLLICESLTEDGTRRSWLLICEFLMEDGTHR
ncbi:4762_t:CDS:2 [Rhizophagus irregularis]|nr:4762_t:CDS:2 [Rhizophagus irregularis]